MEHKKTFLFLLICSGWASMCLAGRLHCPGKGIRRLPERRVFEMIMEELGVEKYDEQWLTRTIEYNEKTNEKMLTFEQKKALIAKLLCLRTKP